MQILKQNISRFTKLVPVLILLLAIPSGCSLLKPGNQRKVEKKQVRADKEADKAYQDLRKQHLKKQNKETLKMMKSTKKQANAHNRMLKRKHLFGRRQCN